MPILNVYVDERTLLILRHESERSGRAVEELASAAVESEAIRSVPPQVRDAIDRGRAR